jgi:hypothetical protein
MLIKVKYLDYEATTAYAPPQRDGVLNTEEVVTAVPTEARGSGPFLLVRFRDGSQMTIVGEPGLLVGHNNPSSPMFR